MPEGLAAEIAAWEKDVSDALADEPELQAQFNSPTQDNPFGGLVRAHPEGLRFQERLSFLDSIIKHLTSQRAS